MNSQAEPLSPIQAELLRQILNDGNSRVGHTIKMILGQSPDELQVHTTMVKLSELKSRFPEEPMVAVRIGFEGDIKGQFMYLQPLRDFAGTRKVLEVLLSGQSGTVADAAGFLRDEWVQSSRESAELSDERIKDVLGELSNVLFGNYLTAIYSRCALATFQELPEVRNPDRERRFLLDGLDHFSSRAERAFVAEIDGLIGENSVHFWLVMMAEPDGFKAMLESLRNS